MMNHTINFKDSLLITAWLETALKDGNRTRNGQKTHTLVRCARMPFHQY